MAYHHAGTGLAQGGVATSLDLWPWVADGGVVWCGVQEISRWLQPSSNRRASLPSLSIRTKLMRSLLSLPGE